MDKIYKLEGKPIHLTSSQFEGWILSVVFGDIIISNIQKHKWRLVPSKDDSQFIILSATLSGTHAICSGDGTHEKAILCDLADYRIVPDKCRWRVSKKGEFCQGPPGKELYLWVVNKELRTTPDSFLAEIWEFY